jgi:cell division protein FtsN
MKPYRKVEDHYEVRIEGGRLALLGVGAALVLVLVFLLGVLVGKGLWGGRRPVTVPLAEGPRDVLPAPSAGEPEKRPDLTFYDDLKRPDGKGTETFRETQVPAPATQAETAIPARPEPEAPPSAPPAASAQQPRESPAPAKPRPEPKPAVPQAVFTVQVGSFRDRGAAEELAARMKGQGVSPQVVAAPVGGRTWYRVQVGLYDTRAEAENLYRKTLRPKGIQGFVTTR